MPLIALEHVSRLYTSGATEVLALDDVSLHIEAGEMVAIMGASGSGKSTLMNLLGCLDKPTDGRLLVDGKNLSELSSDEMAALRRETFGFIFQRYHLLPHLDAAHNVELPAVYAGLNRRERRERAVALLRRLGLGDRLTHRPDELSGGQQQRVSIARALINGGRIILADEPTGALDSASGAELLVLLGELNALGHTVILVTHDAEVASQAKRIIELRDGRIVRDAAVSEPVGQPAPRETAGLPTVSDGPGHWTAPWREALTMSLTALNGNRLRSVLSMLGISIGIAAVVSITALGDAARTHVQISAQEASASKLVVAQSNRNLPFGAPLQSLTARDAAALRSLPGVTAVEPHYSSRVPARYGRNNDFVTANGVVGGDIDLNGQIIVQGRDIADGDLDGRSQVVVLDSLAKETLFTSEESAIGQRVILGALPFTVIGIVQPAYVKDSLGKPYFKAQGTVYIPRTTYATKLDTGQDTDSLTVHFSAQASIELFREQVRQRLLALHGGIEDFSLDSNEMLNSIFTGLLTKLSGVLSAIAGISLLVGGVGVMNIMLVSVSERTREIGIRMAVGARQRDVRRQFLIESVLLCCLGGLGGLALPWLVAQIMSFVFPGMPLAISWEALGLSLCACTAIGILFGNLPARSAAAMSPVIALARD
ncbi:ATP-binding cassette domain-containing protein [Rugamonas sp. FT82W]|uniref:ATP-binding cassette domain-containing protein n=1 Tax=Duganella vulcania TaxID=2692166 RepID=A0A845FZ85_9BURK|nr:ATP-binding cassette domain-containing protein [Duganella vulcania]MYM85878.1 ATP-binding cassette domain-containing protein [Duganella vulcania]